MFLLIFLVICWLQVVLFLKNRNGISCILGTGSNCAYFDGSKNYSITHSLGHLFGDEGSGYDLGKEFLTHYFQDDIPTTIKKKLEKQTNMNQEELISSIYSSKNQKFYIASFSKFLKEYESDPFIKKNNL